MILYFEFSHTITYSWIKSVLMAVALVGAFGLTRLREVMLFGVSATDPMTFGLVAAVLGGVAMLASYLPARRAARTDPVEALRAE